MTRKDEYRTAGETAKLLGVTMKALKVYEDRGLITPQRTEAGWRVYGPEEVETITKILALKSAGFSLSDVKTLLEGRLTVKDALEKQSHMLRRQAQAIE
ncbi:MAG: MerR family transcriptional regulator, partial [Pseudomonadota bacterium]